MSAPTPTFRQHQPQTDTQTAIPPAPVLIVSTNEDHDSTTTEHETLHSPGANKRQRSESPSPHAKPRKWKAPTAVVKHQGSIKQTQQHTAMGTEEKRLRRAFWSEFIPHVMGRNIHFNPFPHLAWAHVDLFSLYAVVEQLGGPENLLRQQRIAVLKDELGREFGWTTGWETVYKRLGFRAHIDSEPSRRLRLFQIYDRFFSKFVFTPPTPPPKNSANGNGEENGEAVTDGSPLPLSYVRCACGHSHELPCSDGITCKTCATFPETVPCSLCGAVQHIACLVNFGLLAPDKAEQWEGTLRDQHICEICAQHTAKPSVRLSFQQLFQETLLRWELPQTWVVECWYEDFGSMAVKLEYYILRGIDVYEGRKSTEAICTERHLKAVLAGQEREPSTYHPEKTGQRKGKANNGKSHKKKTRDRSRSPSPIRGKETNGTPAQTVRLSSHDQGPYLTVPAAETVDPPTETTTLSAFTQVNCDGVGVTIPPRPHTPMSRSNSHTATNAPTSTPAPPVALVQCLPDVSLGKEMVNIPAFAPTREEHPLTGVQEYVLDYVYGEGVSPPPPGPPGCECRGRCDSIECSCVAQNPGRGSAYDERGRLVRFDQPVVFECSGTCKCSAACGNRVVQAGLRHRLEVFRTGDKGWGVRTSEFLARGSFVCSYEGELVTEETAHRRGFAYDHTYEVSYLMDLNSLAPPHEQDRCLTIDSTLLGNVARFINHGCTPNLHKQNVYTIHRNPFYYKLALFAARDIQAGEELCYDYGYQVGSVRGKYITCKCGTENCRGRLL